MTDKSPDVPEEFKVWAKLGDIPGLPSYPSVELLNELKPWIDASRVQVEAGTDIYFRLLGSKYPIGVNRIDWSSVREHLAFDVFPITKGFTTGEETEVELNSCRGTLLGWFFSSGNDLEEWVVWIGDDSNVSLHMTIKTLLELYPLLFSWPMHHYVLPITGEWCLNYTMEGQLFFGREENAIGPKKC